MKQRALALCACAALLTVPLAHAASVHAQMVSVPDPITLRLPPDAFLPATLTTDEVENNEPASANYIGTHHPVGYAELGRISGYYERAVYGGTTYLRYQASTFASDSTANDVLNSSVNWAATHFGAADTCAGDDDSVDAQGNAVDTDNSAGNGPIDQDAPCQLTNFGFPPPGKASQSDDPRVREQDDVPATPGTTCLAPVSPTGVIPPDTQPYTCQTVGIGPYGPNYYPAPNTCGYNGNATCPAPAQSSANPGIRMQNACEPDGDADDAGGPPDAPSLDQVCSASTQYTGGNGGSVGGAPSITPLTPIDCTAVFNTPCYLLGFGYSDATDTMWYDIYGVMQVHQCLAEVTLTSRPQAYGAIKVTGIMSAAYRVLQASCTGT